MRCFGCEDGCRGKRRGGERRNERGAMMQEGQRVYVSVGAYGHGSRYGCMLAVLAVEG